MSYFQIDAGHRAVQNGSKWPLTQLFDLAKLLDQTVIAGGYYGDDYLRVPENAEDKQVIIDLLNETKLIWKEVDELPVNLQFLE